MEKTGFKVICGAPTTLAVKGLMIMMSLQKCECLALVVLMMALVILMIPAGLCLFDDSYGRSLTIPDAS